jgi:hypothetical protein
MSGTLPEILLRIAAAAAPDGGAGVKAALVAALQEKAAFDAGDIVLLSRNRDPLFFSLGAEGPPIVGRDLVEYVIVHRAPHRLDDLPEAQAFPSTLALLREQGLRSALVVPFRFDEPGMAGASGVLALARTHGWAFVGVSLPVLVPLAAMAGLALDHALRLSALGERAHALEVVSPWAAPAAERRQAQEREAAAARPVEDPSAASGVGEEVREALREAREAGRQLRARLAAAEERLLEAERLRDDWAQQAGALRTRTEEQEGAIRSLKREVVGARETAASAAEVAGAREAQIHELEVQLRKVGLELRSHLEAQTPAPAPEERDGPRSVRRSLRGGRSR